MIRKFILSISAFFFLWGIIYSYNAMTDGFDIRQIQAKLPYYPQYEIDLSLEQKEEIENILNQPFHYIGKGCQFYAFQSKDSRYVIKFLKHKHLRLYDWVNLAPLPSHFKAKLQAKNHRREARIENLFASCKLAYDEMPELTGLFYIHLNASPALCKDIVLVDKLGLKHEIYLDDHQFILQQRAIPVKEAFQDGDQIQEKIHQLVQLVIERCEKGICDRDRSFVQNVAFRPDGKGALFIDIGQFYKDANIFSKEEQKKDLKKRLANLQFWTEKHYPQFSFIVENEIKSLENF